MLNKPGKNLAINCIGNTDCINCAFRHCNTKLNMNVIDSINKRDLIKKIENTTTVQQFRTPQAANSFIRSLLKEIGHFIYN